MNTPSDEQRQDQSLTHDDLDQLLSERDSPPHVVPRVQIASCPAFALIQHNTPLMQSTLIQDLQADASEMSAHDVQLNIDAIQSIHFDLELGLIDDLPADKPARDQLRHHYAQEEKLARNVRTMTPIDTPAPSLFQRIYRALFGHQIHFD
jgi:hypothetical protein